MLIFVRGRIMIGVGAWLLGAGTATGGSLLAVSLIGQGMSGFASQPLTAAAVSAAAARADSDESAGLNGTAPTTGATSPVSGPSGIATAGTWPRPSSAPGQSPPPDPASPTATAGTNSDTNTGTNVGTGTGSVLSSQGGNVVASCQSAGVYLISWSPQQGYAIDDVRRGPAAQAWVTFESPANSVVMEVTCQGGVPQATSTVDSGVGSSDD